MRKQEEQTQEVKSGEVVTSLKEYTLKEKITYKGEPKGPGAKVKLNARQAERLKESGHI
ncbi:DUF7210 family protein [Marinobacter nauticus]|uniref:DUF7210 family protein n=1 Tax=Marinobacter nauticus TaxID=2743 RepID=UPI003734ECA1